MTVTTIHVVPVDGGQWAVEGDETGPETTYGSRAEAIAAGVHKALENEAILLILGRSRERSEPDFGNNDLTPERN
ncbi:DUF2188 domain-containing protein [Cupriavidus consociatus]|uniref:DUF2188 domain-containing protein n=1 Tax=Cupriavidus consociatus TaxID=2821357 RepID=UPI001AE2DFA9|nr:MULTISPECIES: DUF2188 domain-containing protein [unclassified Cupriavidus]MBP0618640.1 DUF2188 domain-containing protein [Cupriavidus sp. LEh25]MDK2655280.1 DUF2188 domain-containing protein [Cupriavidus sp. LEh21]